jgi:hypothetical protein
MLNPNTPGRLDIPSKILRTLSVSTDKRKTAAFAPIAEQPPLVCGKPAEMLTFDEVRRPENRSGE